MIQNRTTMLTSLQPASSKWCCSGAIRNTRLPVVLNEPIWMITDIVMIDEQAAEDGSSSTVRVAIARPAIRPPSASEPVSPMKIRAGDVFHHRKPTQAAAAAAAISAISSGSRTS